jgi:hypothetical protein
MTMAKEKRVQTFPVMDGAGPAPREDQIAGIVQKVWGESIVYHADVEQLLRQLLTTYGCVIADDEFQVLLVKARGEFAGAAKTTETDTTPHCPASTVVRCLYWDVQALERGGFHPTIDVP